MLTVSADERIVTARWEAPPDDVRVIEARHGDVSAYVAANVRVSQGGGPCDQAVASDGGAAGVMMTFTCPAAVDVVTLQVSILQDVNPTYQTLALVPPASGPDRVLFTSGVTHRTFDLAPGGATANAPPAAPAAMPGSSLPGVEARLVGLASQPLPLPALIAAIGVALLVGAAHALAPGHGKSVAAAYLVAERGQVRDAAALGVTVAAMHTVSVLGVGLGAFAAVRSAGVARVLPWLSVLAGIALLVLGAVVLAHRWRDLRRGNVHGHRHEPLSGAGLGAVAAAGGLLPSPSALAALLAAVAVGRIVLGLALVTAFSVGLAAAVTLVGVAALRGRDVVSRRLGTRLRWLPLVGAAGVAAAGMWLTVAAVLRV